MQLVKASKWARETFESGSRPKTDKIINWIDAGAIPGVILDGVPYVDAERFALQCTCPKEQPGGRLSAIDLLTG